MRAQWGAIGAAVAMAASLTVTLGGGTAVGVGSGPSVTIDDPGAVQAGPVTLMGRVGAQAGGQTTVLYVVDGGGHTWPGKPVPGFEDLLGHATTDIDATSLLFEFFLGSATS